jgi:hypothetical protein
MVLPFCKITTLFVAIPALHYIFGLIAFKLHNIKESTVAPAALRLG